jgi:transcriptional regulator with XRE-family HTH domain
MKFNYAKLLGRMREYGFTQEQLAKDIGINKATLSSKLNNRFSFTQEEMLDICKLLNIPVCEMGDYFYAV